MRATHITALGIAVLTTVGCVHTARIQKHDTASALAGGYATFFILDGHSSGSAQMDQQIKSDIKRALADKGWIEAPPDEGDVVVVVHAATAAKHSRDTWYEGWGGWRWRVGGATTPTASEQSYKEGTLVVDVFDAWTKQVLWRGVATDALPANPTSHAAGTQKAIDTMFENLLTLPVDDQRGPRDSVNGQGATTRFQSPRIIFSPAPALLVPVRGEPVYRDVAGSGLQRILNTPLLIVRNDAGVHYLKTFDGWMEADTLTGNWSVAGTAPDGADAVLAEVGDGASQGLADTPHVSGEPAPAVYVSTTPAALIVTEGDPRFVPLNGTSLFYVSNTTAHVFKEPTDQELYVLVSSRWFRAWTTNGPWEHVPDDELPSDIARIPRDVLQANM